jgi:hypothetical protein
MNEKKPLCHNMTRVLKKERVGLGLGKLCTGDYATIA